MSNESRHSKRQAIEYPAQIEAEGGVRLPCRLRDVSKSGARILVQSTKGIPDDFVLLLAQEGAARRFCHVAWRTERELGVKFHSSQPQPLGRPVLQPQAAEESQLEIVKLDS